jgi:hypothetical protein
MKKRTIYDYVRAELNKESLVGNNERREMCQLRRDAGDVISLFKQRLETLFRDLERSFVLKQSGLSKLEEFKSEFVEFVT